MGVALLVLLALGWIGPGARAASVPPPPVNVTPAPSPALQPPTRPPTVAERPAAPKTPPAGQTAAATAKPEAVKTPKPSLSVKADSFTFNNEANTFACEGKVDAVYGETMLTSDHLDGSVDPATHSVDKFIATGNVVIVNPEWHATGQKADFNLATGVVILTGTPEKRPQLWKIEKDGKSGVIQEADEITYDSKNKVMSTKGKSTLVMPDASLGK